MIAMAIRRPEIIETGDARQGQNRPGLNLSSDPILWLNSRRIFRDPLSGLTEEQLRITRDAESYRQTAARHLQRLFERGEVSPVWALDYGMSVDASAWPGDVSNAAIDAMREVARIRDRLPRPAWEILQRMLQDDVRPWDAEGLTRWQRRMVYERIRWGLDALAVYMGMLKPWDFRTRWPSAP